MTLELSRLTGQVQAMGEELASRERQYADLVGLARRWLVQYADQVEPFHHSARAIRAAIPTGEPLDAHYPLPAIPDQITVAAADGSQIQPDRHGAVLYHLINVGSLVYRHNSGEAPEAQSIPTLGYAEEDLYEGGMLVAGNLLDVRRDLAEITHLADVSVSEPPRPTIALVDGSLILWVLDDLPFQERQKKMADYLEQLDRIRQAGVVVAGFVSRPRHGEVTRLLHLANVDGDANRASQEPNPLERLPDRAVFEMLPPGARSALFINPSSINHDHYHPAGHTIHFFYLNLAHEGRRPVIARLETPAWVAQDEERLALVHGAVVAQARITGDYPYALARADELAYVSSQERGAFEEMVARTLVQSGMHMALSPKQYQKTLTRRGRRKSRL